MTDSFLSAGAPEFIAALQAIKAFNSNIGPDPTKWPLTVAPALVVLLGTVQLQVPALVTAEAATVQNQLNAKIDGWIAQLQKPA